MEAIDREAWLTLVQRERQAEAERQAKELEKRRRLKERLAKEATLREAAFDGDLATIKQVCEGIGDGLLVRCVSVTGVSPCPRQLLEGADEGQELDVDCADPNGETPLLEAAGGGQTAVVQYLLSREANVNVRGKFDRTPLYRGEWRAIALGSEPWASESKRAVGMLCSCHATRLSDPGNVVSLRTSGLWGARGDRLCPSRGWSRPSFVR